MSDRDKLTPKSLDEYIKTVTMFFVDSQLESDFAQAVDNEVRGFKNELLGIATLEGMVKYVREHSDSLEKLISLLNISEEKFKRIITMLRIQKGFVPQGEWSLAVIRANMMSDESWMSDVCDLLMNGATSSKYKDLIPSFYSCNFKVDATTMGRLANEDDLRRLVKKRMEGRYSNRIGDMFFKRVSHHVRKVCGPLGLTCDQKQKVPLVGQRVELAIPSAKEPRLLIDMIYTITTSSVQTQYAKRTENVLRALREHNARVGSDEKVTYVNVVDGAGWVARQSDLGKIHRSSDYLLNLKTLGDLDRLIKAIF